MRDYKLSREKVEQMRLEIVSLDRITLVRKKTLLMEVNLEGSKSVQAYSPFAFLNIACTVC